MVGCFVIREHNYSAAGCCSYDVCEQKTLPDGSIQTLYMLYGSGGNPGGNFEIRQCSCTAPGPN
ncbi:hypothetical protein [Paenibacillus assamensis]|uniref:hypothetical protein n=1 Tax=Paenibacillus assamensis TaxID=311244 RepID=UPI00048EE706|nr:hypothetical protein [Paenibacillus assamensis]